MSYNQDASTLIRNGDFQAAAKRLMFKVSCDPNFPRAGEIQIGVAAEFFDLDPIPRNRFIAWALEGSVGPPVQGQLPVYDIADCDTVRCLQFDSPNDPKLEFCYDDPFGR